VAEEQSVAARTLAPAEATATPASAPSQRAAAKSRENGFAGDT
jgi:hypothetical protein